MNIKKQTQQVLILGAGELGMAMLKGFVAERQHHPDTQLSVLLRPSSPRNQYRLQQCAAWNINVVTGDFSGQSEEALADIFINYDAIVNCSGFAGGTGTQLKITRAVLKAGVARYFPWQFGVDYDVTGKGSGQPVWDEQLEVRNLLREQQQTRWVIVSTGIFTSYLFEPASGIVDRIHRRVYAPGSADFAVTMTTPDDIGRLTANIYFHQPTIHNRIIYVAGDTVTYRRLVTLLRQFKPYELEVESLASLQATVLAAPDNRAAAYRLAFARSDGVAWEMSQTWNVQQHIPVTSLADWLQANPAAI